MSRIDDASYVSNILQIGDRILAINGKKVEDKIQCKKLILDNNGDFEALIERNKPIPEVTSLSLASLKKRQKKVFQNNTFRENFGTLILSFALSLSQRLLLIRNAISKIPITI